MGTYNAKIAHAQGGNYIIIGEDANGLPAILTSGSAASDGDIVTDIGADTLWADGSIYVSVVDGAGKLYLKTNDVWVDQK
jgi:hypothetical protein